MSYQTLVGQRNARVVQLLESNPSVRRFVQELCAKLAEHAGRRESTFAKVRLDETYVVNVTGDEKIRARIIRGL